ncbi:MAG: phosphotransferase [Paenirhodobacter sp.]|uniref:phosphotransferase n=1 Tax=Paenirhodobacter sp. TaxID=1965326 RepID=UPI003D0FE090
MGFATSTEGALDLGALSVRCARIAPETAAAILREHYGLAGTLQRFDTEMDDTFRLLTPEGRGFILKIANPGETLVDLDLQVSVLRHLEAVAPELPVPRVFADRTGAFLPEIATPEGTRRMRLMSYLEGTVLDTVTPTAEERAAIGRICGALRLALAGFTHPGAARRLAWDIRQLPGLAPLLAHVADPAQARALERGLDRFAALMPQIEALPRQVLHNDFNRSNLLVARPGPARVAGIIDFGDTVETAIAIDLSTAMMNQMPRDGASRMVDDMLAEPREVMRGYLEIAPLTDTERALLPHLVMGRVVTRALLSLWRAARFPDNARYILRNTEQGWAQLDWFLARDADAVSSLLL